MAEHRVVPFVGPRSYTVVSPTGSVSAQGTDFTTRYNQVGLSGSLEVLVEQGQVEVQDRQRQRSEVAAGSSSTLQDLVPRVTIIRPADEASVVMGSTTGFRWTGFPEAAGYLIEYTFSASGFPTRNPSGVESPQTTLPVGPGAFTQSEGQVDFRVSLEPNAVPRGTRAFLRVFPTDATGQVLPNTTASDPISVVIR